MKLYADCIPCLLQIRFRDIAKVVEDEENRRYMVREILKLFNELVNIRGIESSVKISTELFRFVKKLTGIEDIYAHEKHVANVHALQVYQRLKPVLESIADPAEVIEYAMRFSIVGNALDFGVANYTPPSIDELVERAKSMHVEGDVDRAVSLLLEAKSIAVLLDNAGEAVLDRLLGDALRKLGKKVIAIVKSKPFQNDITVREAEEAGLYQSFDAVLESGSDAASIFLEYLPEETRRVLTEVDVVVSKGMANYEYLTEVEHIIDKPIVYLLIAKCRPIAKELGVAIGVPTVYVSQRSV